MSSRRRRLTRPPYTGPWQLLGFGEFGTPERRYAIFDPNGWARWAGETVAEAQVFILDHGLEPYMERYRAGGMFVRESLPANDSSKDNLEHGLGPWGGAGE